MTDGHRITDRGDALDYVLAGKSTFTVVSGATGQRFTYKVSQPKDKPHFVSVLTGSDNTADYAFLGTIFECTTFRHSKKSRISDDAPSVKAFAWLWDRALTFDAAFEQCELWHLGKCGRCGRDLTDPESIARGLGPTCAEKRLCLD